MFRSTRVVSTCHYLTDYSISDITPNCVKCWGMSYDKIVSGSNTSIDYLIAPDDIDHFVMFCRSLCDDVNKPLRIKVHLIAGNMSGSLFEADGLFDGKHLMISWWANLKINSDISNIILQNERVLWTFNQLMEKISDSENLKESDELVSFEAEIVHDLKNIIKDVKKLQ